MRYSSLLPEEAIKASALIHHCLPLESLFRVRMRRRPKRAVIARIRATLRIQMACMFQYRLSPRRLSAAHVVVSPALFDRTNEEFHARPGRSHWLLVQHPGDEDIHP